MWEHEINKIDAVTDITQAIKKYGVRDEIGYQMVKATKEIGRDLEYAIVANKTKVLGDKDRKSVV